MGEFDNEFKRFGNFEKLMTSETWEKIEINEFTFRGNFMNFWFSLEKNTIIIRSLVQHARYIIYTFLYIFS